MHCEGNRSARQPVGVVQAVGRRQLVVDRQLFGALDDDGVELFTARLEAKPKLVLKGGLERRLRLIPLPVLRLQSNTPG